MDDFPTIEELVDASAGEGFPYKIFVTNREDANKFVRLLWERKDFPWSQVNGVFLLLPDGNQLDITDEVEYVHI